MFSISKRSLGLLLVSMLFCAALHAQSTSPTKVTFTPQWTAQAQFAGYYVAKDMGFYSAHGLDVDIVHPSQSVNAMQMLKSGQSDFITNNLIAAISDNMSGGELQHVLQSSQATGLAVIAQAPISKIEDLEGLKVGRWKAGFSLIAQSAAEGFGVDVAWVDIMGGVNVFLSGAVDANLVMTYNELLTIGETGYKIDPEQVLYFKDFENYNIPEEGVYTLSSYAQRNAETVARFREATAEGWQWVHDNREAALDIVMEWVAEHNIATNRVHQRQMLEEVLLLQYNELGEVSTALDESDFDRAKSMLIGSNAVEECRVEYKSFISQ